MEAALQDQLKCGSSPEPGKALKALQSLGYIGNKPALAIDGMTIWNFIKPVSVFGFKALQVTGWEDKPDKVFFWRGPGTSPPLHFTVVVDSDIKTVEAVLRRDGHVKTIVSKADPPADRQTEISCYAK